MVFFPPCLLIPQRRPLFILNKVTTSCYVVTSLALVTCSQFSMCLNQSGLFAPSERVIPVVISMLKNYLSCTHRNLLCCESISSCNAWSKPPHKLPTICSSEDLNSEVSNQGWAAQLKKKKDKPTTKILLIILMQGRSQPCSKSAPDHRPSQPKWLVSLNSFFFFPDWCSSKHITKPS